MRALILVLCVSSGAACQKQLYGTGVVYLFNGTEQAATIRLDGRSPGDVKLSPKTGQLLRERVAGPYQVSILKGGSFPEMFGIEIARDRLTIINVDGAGCFARADVAGMYNHKKAPVKLLESYRDKTIISIRQEIAILPSEPIPTKRSRASFGFQRVTELPCELLDDDWTVEDYLQRRR